MFWATDAITLKSAHLCFGYRRTQIGIFTGAFNDAPPARVARNIYHRRNRPVDADRPRLTSRNRLRALDHLRIPRSSHSNWHRENSVETVDDGEAEDKRNFKAQLGEV